MRRVVLGTIGHRHGGQGLPHTTSLRDEHRPAGVWNHARS
jgi:hypothetical protein